MTDDGADGYQTFEQLFLELDPAMTTSVKLVTWFRMLEYRGGDDWGPISAELAAQLLVAIRDLETRIVALERARGSS